jgi:hypothetical protein
MLYSKLLLGVFSMLFSKYILPALLIALMLLPSCKKDDGHCCSHAKHDTEATTPVQA